MPRILALDVGVTTGWATLTRGDLWEWGVIADTHMGEVLPKLLAAYTPDHIVVERPLIIRGPLGDKLSKVLGLVNYFLDGRAGVEYIEPSDWKSTPWAKSTTPGKTSQHEKDAIRMARWYNHRLQGKE